MKNVLLVILLIAGNFSPIMAMKLEVLQNPQATEETPLKGGGSEEDEEYEEYEEACCPSTPEACKCSENCKTFTKIGLYSVGTNFLCCCCCLATGIFLFEILPGLLEK